MIQVVVFGGSPRRLAFFQSKKIEIAISYPEVSGVDGLRVVEDFLKMCNVDGCF